jgi:hypothetical protein
LRNCKTRDIAAALLKKGFEERASHHRIFYLIVDGKISSIHTFLSHGVKEYNVDLLTKMRTQLHITGKELDDLIHCPLSGKEYVMLLVERGVLEK